MKLIKAVTLILIFIANMEAYADDSLNIDYNLHKKSEFDDRKQRVDQWYAPARFGLFCHWGLFTSGGDSSTAESRPFHYNTVAEFEAAAPEPEVIASNLVATAEFMGAKYLTMTLLHSCDRYTVLFPTKAHGFRMKTTKDYIGALATRCQQKKLRLMLYVCSGPEHAFPNGEGPWLDESLRDKNAYVRALKELLNEVATRYPNEIAGFWIDGTSSDLPAYMRQHFPGCVIIHNNDVGLSDSNIDYGTTEFLSGAAEPVYSRPSALVRTNPKYNILPPRSDYNEDIPCTGSWWYGEYGTNDAIYDRIPYVESPTFIVKQMVASLGVRRKWNFAIGIGPTINGKLPGNFDPMMKALGNFFEWASESIYDTVGGEGSALNPGWWNDGAYGGITVSIKDPKVLYIHVTTAPKAPNLRLINNGYQIASVEDLRTKSKVPFSDGGFLVLWNGNWADVDTYGDKIFKVTLAK